MNPFRQELQSMAADVNYQLAIEFGELVTYTPRGGAPLSVYCMPASGGKSDMRQVVSTNTQETHRTFRIPMQPADAPIFPPANGPMGYDRITDEFGNTYVVGKGWNNDNLGDVYTFKDCMRSIAKTGGQVA